MDGLPGVEAAQGGDQGEQPLEQCGSRPLESDDEHRRPHRAGEHCGLRVPLRDDPQPVAECPDEILPCDDAAEGVEPRLAVDGVDELLKGLEEQVVAEIREPGGPPGRAEQGFHGEVGA